MVSKFKAKLASMRVLCRTEGTFHNFKHSIISIYTKNILLLLLFIMLKSRIISQKSQISCLMESLGFIFCVNPRKYFIF